MTEHEPRRVLGEPEETYFKKSLDVATNSGLKVLNSRSPMGYHFYITNEDDEESTAAKDFGRAFHTSVLEPHKFFSTYCVLPDDAPRRPTAAQWNAAKPSANSAAAMDWWRRWMGDNQGRMILTAKEYDMAVGMGKAARENVLEIPDGNGKFIEILGGELFDLCDKEVTYYWTDERTGIACKARVDLDCDEFQFGGDLKSCENAEPEAFARTITNYGYHQQHAHYCDGRAKVTGKPWKNFLFFACEKRKPHVPSVCQINAMAEERGFVLRDRALTKLAGCLREQRWPPYSKRIVEIALPAYAHFDSPMEDA